jgi:uncharacterized membrane protein
MAEPRQRHEWIDLLRGIAVVGMVWTHAANTFLDAALQATPGFRTLTFYHGLVAPMFFWVAGFMRGMAAARTGPTKSAWPTVKRLSIIWAVGVLIHVPWDCVGKGEFGASCWCTLLQSDVLNCLSISCLILLGIERMMAGRATKAWVVVLGAGLAVVLASGTMEKLHTGFILTDSYFTKTSGSLFPLFPWFGFACAGFVTGNFGSPSWRTAAVGAVMAFGLPWIPGESGIFLFFLERLGWVIMIATAVASMNDQLASAPRWLMLAGRESLWVYVVHLHLIHAVPIFAGRSMDRAIGATQSVGPVALIFVGLLAASLGIAWLNEQRKRRRGKV